MVEARFTDTSIEASVNNNGALSKSKLTLPKDGRIYDDPVTALQAQPGIAGKVLNFYIFDPTSVALMKNRAFFGDKELVDGISLAPIVVEDPRLTTKVYLSAKGDIVKVGTSIGVEMKPLSKAEALAEIKDTGTRPDLAEVTAIRPTPPIQNPQNAKFLRMKLSADNLRALPSGDFQKVEKAGVGWIVGVSQPASVPSKTILECAKAQPTWLKASHLIPSDNPKMLALAKKVVGTTTDSGKAAEKIRSYVNSTMTPDAGIGILRDASEVLKTKVGVCRDYAILTATLCRAAKLPTKLASGLVSFDGTFYYHAWVEVFTGSRWVPYDSIPSSPEFTATHVKLSEGNVDTAFAFTVLSGAKIEVLEQK
jgi:transglutaminase-like putative cysteine protease